ncbi:cytochrome P450 94C1-like [Salvia hispanica]|uniref:cytochrome P450 94C1-like n=1 Tax=Salvia hispanica TaxID=49212 RepID=UPI0020090223|nr:cytochrome P450 94C1-like [Salvia hispanica]
MVMRNHITNSIYNIGVKKHLFSHQLINIPRFSYKNLNSSKSMDSSFILFFSLALVIILSISIIITRLTRSAWCSCAICQSYVDSQWRSRFTNLSDWHTHLLQSSPSRTVHIHVTNNVITANPANVEYILQTKFHNFPKGKPFSSILADFLGRGIFNADGDTWRFQRKMAGLELARASLRAYALEVVHHEIHRCLIPAVDSASREKGVLDLQDVFRRFSFDCICRFSFGVDPTCLELSDFEAAFDVASRLSAERAMAASPLVWRAKRWLGVGSERRLRRAVADVDALAEEVIRQRRRFGSAGRRDLLSRFMDSVSDETYLRDIIVNFLLAGRDTVGSALTSFFWLAARHPGVEAAILEEADRVMGVGNSRITEYEEMRGFHYLHAAVHESMRMYPPVQFDSKFCLEDDVLPDGCPVKKGTRVTYHPYAMGRIEEIWGPDWADFKPERWLRDRVFCQENPYKYPVFQGGVRVCLGKEMALLEVESVALALLREYRVELIDYRPVPVFSPGLTATYRDGLPVLVHRR